MMLENGIPSALYFGKEFSGWRAASYAWRNHEIVISKMPHDLFRLDSLRCFYSMRSAELKIILTLPIPATYSLHSGKRMVLRVTLSALNVGLAYYRA